MWAQSLGWKDTLEKIMGTHSIILAWRIPMDKRSLAGYSLWGPKSQAHLFFLGRLSSGFSNYSQWKIWFKVLTVQVCGSLVFKFYILTTKAKL